MRILILDDDRAARASIRRLLEEEGHSVVEAHAALEAIALVREQHFDLAIIDWELGTALTGADVARHIPPYCARIMVSGHSKEEIGSHWEDPLKGILHFVSKPIDWNGHPRDSLKALVERVEKSLEDTRP